MIKLHSPGMLKITANDKRTLDHDLNTAVEIIRRDAMQDPRAGILVTQESYTDYTVTISPGVPYGLTHERRAWERTSGA